MDGEPSEDLQCHVNSDITAERPLSPFACSQHIDLRHDCK